MVIYPWLETIWQSLKSRQNIPQALLIHGQAGLGKSTLAQLLAQSILCMATPDATQPCYQCRSCHLVQHQCHPGLFNVQSAETGVIKIAPIRELTQALYNTVTIGRSKVVIIDLLEALNVNAANALLKCLEEPPPHTVFITVSHNISALLPTIRSRCIALPIRTPPTEIAQIWLAQQGVEEASTIHLALQMSDGAPLRALAFCRAAQQQMYHTVCQDLQALLQPSVEVIAISERWQKLPLFLLIDYLQRILHALLCQYSGASSLSLPELMPLLNQISIANITRWYDELCGMKQHLRSGYNVNAQYWIDALVTKIYFRGLL